MDEHHGISASTRSCRVVVEPRPTHINELAAHPVNLALFAQNGILEGYHLYQIAPGFA